MVQPGLLGKLNDHRTFQHTSIACYLLAAAAVGSIFWDSTQGILQRYELNKKWYYLWGVTCFFAWLYIRPLISGYINFQSVYIGWLCGAVFLHLPSLKSLGLDFRTDVSVLLTLFLLTLLALVTLHGLHGLAVFCKLLSPALYNPFSGFRDWSSIILLNSFNLAVACSTYYSFCGNPVAHSKGTEGGGLKAAVCSKWLHPIDMREHPALASWVIYGEGATAGKEPQLVQIDLPLDGRGMISIPASETISPILSMWLTLFLMYIANSLADYWAASCLQAEAASGARKGRQQALTRRSPVRRRSAEHVRSGSHIDAAHTLEALQRSVSLVPAGALASSVSSLVRHMSRGVSQGLQSGLPALDSLQGSLSGLSKPAKPGHKQSPPSPALTVNRAEPFLEEQPDFLPMVPWYSGTSADMYKTVFDLLISVKLFLGRFDMRTMQAATAAVPPGSGGEPPRAGDGFTYEHLASRDSLWLDFMADCGDGGDPTYAVAAAMAAPLLHVTVPEGLEGAEGAASPPGSPSSSSSSSSSGLDSPPGLRRGAGGPPKAGACILPRGEALVIGGDLAYPSPTNETYETRFFRPYEAAMPAPAHAVPGALVLHKPDLPLGPPRPCEAPPSDACVMHAGLSRFHADPGACRTCQATAALEQYGGPSCFAIPGNHDWIDGLETFQRHIQHRGWLGGWLLPQENSYFALRLPQGWWLFGLDLALLDDIDMCQCRYFARIADERMGPNDAAILVTHQPRWLMDWFWEEAACHNLRQLVRGHLRGRARVHLSGDLHFYMRHSFQPAPAAARSPLSTQSSLSEQLHATSPAAGSADAFHKSPFAATAPQSAFADAARPRPRTAPDAPQQNGYHKPTANGVSLLASSNGKVRQTPVPSPPPSHASSDETLEAAALYEELASAAACVTSGVLGTSKEEDAISARANHHPFDPEHLIVQGMGGAFLHPTHVFASARFGSIPEPPPDYGLLRGSSPRGRSPEKQAPPRGASPPRGTSPRGSSPAGRRLSRRNSAAGELGVGKLEDGGAGVPGGGGEFCCKAAYPSPETSLRLGRLNLHVFRMQNTKFDIIGGALYFLLVVSVMPQCGHVAAVLEAPSLAAACGAFGHAVLHAVGAIFSDAYLSLGALAFLFVMSLAFAKGGGAGAIPTATPPAGGQDSFWLSLALRGRSGGLPTQLVIAAVHTGMHLAAAVVLMVLLELGVETCIKYESLGAEGYHSLFAWYQRFEAETFPDPRGLRGSVSAWTGGLYPGCLKAAFALFDVPEAIAVSRNALCKGVTSLTRLQTAAYYGGMLAYYWVLATPTIGFFFGCYLYVCVNVLYLHYDEAFSSLRIPHYKGFCRLRITPSGDLNIYSLGMDRVPNEWREDARWRRRRGAGSRRMAGHAAEVPSRWAPLQPKSRLQGDPMNPADPSIKLVDFVCVPKRSPHARRRSKPQT